MQEPEDVKRTTLILLPKHVEHLLSVHDNQSEAIRRIIDDHMQTAKRHPIFDNIIIISLGLIFVFFAFIIPNLVAAVVSTLFGVWFVSYGVIGGIAGEIRRTNKR